MLRSLYYRSNNLRYNLGLGKFTHLLNLNKELKDAASDVRRCFILATGPSIKTQDLSGLKDEFCISVSNFFVHPLFRDLQPRYHIFAGAHPPITKEQIVNWWKDANVHIKGTETNILLHANDKKVRDEFSLFDDQQVWYYLEGGKFPVNFAKQIPPFQTVVHIALYLALYLGIKEIYLLGVDHSWLLHYGESMHFYQEEQHALHRANYREWSEVKDIGDEFETHTVLWKIYRNIRAEAKKKGASIFNATPGSLLDIFPRVNLESLINQ